MNADSIPRLEVSTGRFRLASPRSALVLTGLALVLLVGWVPLTVLTRDLLISESGLAPFVLLTFAAVGLIVARDEPRNPIGWIMLAVALSAGFGTDVRLYLVLDYRLHGGRLPFGQAALFWNGGYTLLPILFGLQAILLFPDGQLSNRWRRALRVYLVLAVLFMACQFAGAATESYGSAVQVDLSGSYSGSANPTGIGADLQDWSWTLVLPFLGFWVTSVAHQIGAWRRSSGERREQLKWLAAGAACSVAGSIAVVVFGGHTSLAGKTIAAVGLLGIAGFPLSIGVGILKYRLYEIDRLISRTLSYVFVTGLLAGVFVGVVVLATDVLPFSSPVAVAASTLAVAALFNPIRLRTQRVVDRRFNRARYDAESIVATFSAHLREALDVDTVRHELVTAAEQAVQPTHVSVWMR